jgi:hypothetical protein
VVIAAIVATQLYGKHIIAEVNQHAKIEEAVFSVEAASRLYNEGLKQFDMTRIIIESLELVVGRIIVKKRQERN